MKNLKGFIHVRSQIKHIKLYWEFSCCRYTQRLIFNAEQLQRRIVDYVWSLCVWMEREETQRLWFITFKLPYSPSFFTSQNFSSFHWLSYICACTPLNHDINFSVSLNGALLLAYTHKIFLLFLCCWLWVLLFNSHSSLPLTLPCCLSLSVCVYVRFYAASDTIFH